MRFYTSLRFTMASVALAGASLGVSATDVSEFNFTHALPGIEAAPAFGFGKSDVEYDVAMKIQEPSLVGYEILGITVPIPSTGGECRPDGVIWLSEELSLMNKKFYPDTDIADGTITNYGTSENPDYQLRATFEEPYTITSDGIFVGYSITVKSLESNSKKYPVTGVSNPGAPGSLWIHCPAAAGSNAKYAEWGDRYADSGISSAMIVHLRGPRGLFNATVDSQQLVCVETGKTAPLNVSIVNYGAKSINNIDYTLYNPAGEVTASGNLVLPTEIPAYFGYKGAASVNIPSANSNADEIMTLSIDKINGEANENVAPTTDFRLVTRNQLPVRRPLIEEYTGLWCGYCPEAYVKTHQLCDIYPDDAIVLAYHCNDCLQTVSVENLPFIRVNAPSLQIDRILPVYDFENLQSMWEERRIVNCPADISVDLFWKDENKTVLVPRANVAFAFTEPEAKYKIGYALVEDNMSDESWSQKNYNFAWEGKEGPYWDIFKDSPSVHGLRYDEVMLAIPETYGFEDSLPETPEPDKNYSHEIEMNPSEALNNYSGGSNFGNPVMRNRDNLRVVAYLVNPETHEVYNAATSCYASEAKMYGASGIYSVAEHDEEVILTEYFTLSGLKVNQAPIGDPYIIINHYKNGETKSAKILQPMQ